MDKIDLNITEIEDIVKNKRYNVNPVTFRKLIGKLLKSNKRKDIENYLDEFVNNANDSFYKSQLAIFILSFYEKYIDDKDKAIQIAKNIIKNTNKPNYALCSLLRICKTFNNYKEVDKLFNSNPEFLKIETFDVLYELTFYYHAKNNIVEIDNIISKIIKRYYNNVPVLNTTKVLALKYGLFDKYESAFYKKSRINLSEKPEEEIQRQIFEQAFDSLLEKTQSSTALADLTNGIAHEFGQPVTNIRFGIQYYSKLFSDQNNELVQKKTVLDVFNDILHQTERIGKLIDRLAPITSTKSHISEFNLIDAIQEAFKQEDLKLKFQNIHSEIKPLNKKFIITFDKVQFNQIITNLLLNSIDSIEERKTNEMDYQGKIVIFVKENKTEYYVIEFSDNGTGINEKDKTRIFNPFYTTKEPGKGQGLGLYIISNLLKIGGGTIKLDENYKNGAKFNILIPKQNKYEL